MSECLTPAGMPNHGPPDPPPAWLTAKPSKCCARCGEPDRHFVTIEDKDYCESCKAIVRLNEFHRLVTGEQTA